jgi:hypothetical protein
MNKNYLTLYYVIFHPPVTFRKYRVLKCSIYVLHSNTKPQIKFDSCKTFRQETWWNSSNSIYCLSGIWGSHGGEDFDVVLECRADLHAYTNISEKYTVSIFRTKFIHERNLNCLFLFTNIWTYSSFEGFITYLCIKTLSYILDRKQENVF